MRYLTVGFLLILTQAGAQVKKSSDKKLYTLAKVWGLMKYYHPALSQGMIDADSLLLASLRYNAKVQINKTIDGWFKMADKRSVVNLTSKKEACDSITLRNFDFKWIQNSGLDSGNKANLFRLITKPENIGTFYSNPTLTSLRYDGQNEKIYPTASTEIKILELFRIWNAIEYFYPYKYALDRKWDAVLSEYIPIFENIKDTIDYKRAISQFSAELQDTHAGLKKTYQYDIFGKFASPFTFQLVENGAVVTALKDEKLSRLAGVEVGDFITKVNSKPLEEIIAEKSKFIPASNPAVQYREAYNYLFSGNEAKVSIEGTRQDGTNFKTNVVRVSRSFGDEWDKDGIPDYHLVYMGENYQYLTWNNQENRLNPSFRLGDKAYIDFSSLRSDEIDGLMQSLQDSKGLVFDLRGYNDDGALLKVFNHLLSKPVIFGIKTQPDFQHPGKFCFVDNIISKNYKYIGKENAEYYKGQVVVLINEYTQSAAEMWAMIFKQIPNVIFIGSQTAGADGNITSIKLTDGNELRFSGLGIYYPDGRETQRIGIKPDIEIRPSLESLRKKQDLLLEKAFSIIDER